MKQGMKPWAFAPMAVLTASALALAACGDRAAETTPEGAPVPVDRTLAQVMDGGDLSTLDGVIEKAGLGTVLEGVAPIQCWPRSMPPSPGTWPNRPMPPPPPR